MNVAEFLFEKKKKKQLLNKENLFNLNKENLNLKKKYRG